MTTSPSKTFRSPPLREKRPTPPLCSGPDSASLDMIHAHAHDTAMLLPFYRRMSCFHRRTVCFHHRFLAVPLTLLHFCAVLFLIPALCSWLLWPCFPASVAMFLQCKRPFAASQPTDTIGQVRLPRSWTLFTRAPHAYCPELLL